MSDDDQTPPDSPVPFSLLSTQLDGDSPTSSPPPTPPSTVRSRSNSKSSPLVQAGRSPKSSPRLARTLGKSAGTPSSSPRFRTIEQPDAILQVEVRDDDPATTSPSSTHSTPNQSSANSSPSSSASSSSAPPPSSSSSSSSAASPRPGVGNVIIKAATLDRLVAELAVADGLPDWTFIADFLITYRYFTTPLDLMSRLRERYAYLVDGQVGDAEERLKWRGPVRLRVINILRRWIEQHWADFDASGTDVSLDVTANNALLQALLDFIEKDIAADNASWAKKLMLQVQINQSATDTTFLDKDAEPEAIAYAMKRPESLLLTEMPGKAGRAAAKAAASAGTQPPLVFTGKAAVSWLVQNLSGFLTPEEGASVGGSLLAARLVVPMSAAEMEKASNKRRDSTAPMVTSAASGAGGGADKAPLALENSADAYYRFVPQPNDPRVQVFPPVLWTPPDEFAKVPEAMHLRVFDKEAGVVELARNLTMRASHLFAQVTPMEVKSQAWASSDARTKSRHLLELIAHFNQLAAWCATQIVTAIDGDKGRLTTLKRMVRLADIFYSMKNFTGLFAVALSFSMASVNRLKKLWKMLPEKYEEVRKRVEDFTSPVGNYRPYRHELKRLIAMGEQAPPAIPYIGCSLGDLTHIEDGNEDNLENGMINFEKMRMLADVWKQLSFFQSSRRQHKFAQTQAIMDFIDKSPVLSEDELYKASLLAEPRTNQTLRRTSSSDDLALPQALPSPKGRRLSMMLRRTTSEREAMDRLVQAHEAKKAAEAESRKSTSSQRLSQTMTAADVEAASATVVPLDTLKDEEEGEGEGEDALAAAGSADNTLPLLTSPRCEVLPRLYVSTNLAEWAADTETVTNLLDVLSQSRADGGIGLTASSSVTGVQLVTWFLRNAIATDRTVAANAATALVNVGALTVLGQLGADETVDKDG
eukprot:CAMPEP_0170738804 /NCGR_PEP_ID=MMETSP0437-20130122/4834_1 /TAXON_ID=0 /ORGANISM="Sexangularia sp." /LENGTH=928 /DNA_ID=CAMNT_0011077239 /DNA_START=31 /DNA_END=2814 /DNA_ORIENTATION=-